MSTSDCNFERSISTKYGKFTLVDCPRKFDDSVKLCKEHLRTELACIKDKDTLKVVQDNIKSGETFLVGLRVESNGFKWEDGTPINKKEIESFFDSSDSESDLDDCKEVFLRKEKKQVFRMRSCSGKSKFFCLNSTSELEISTPKILTSNSIAETNFLNSTQSMLSENESKKFYLLYGTIVGISMLIILFVISITIKMTKKKKSKQVMTDNEIYQSSIDCQITENKALSDFVPSATLYGMTLNDVYNQ